MNIGEKRRKVRTRLKALGELRLAEDMFHRAELLTERADRQTGTEKSATLKMAKTIRDGGEQIRAQASKAAAEIKHLSPMEQEVLLLRYQDGKSWSEICRMLHYSRNTLATVERKAVDKIIERGSGKDNKSVPWSGCSVVRFYV